MNLKVEEFRILLRDFLYPDGNVPEPQKESSAETGLADTEPSADQPEASEKFRPPNTRSEFLEQIINEWRVAFGNAPAQAEIVSRFSRNVKLVADVWSLVRLRMFSPSASKLEEIVEGRLIKVLPTWLEANQDINELVSLKNEFPDQHPIREMILGQIKALIQAEDNLERLFEQFDKADYVGDNGDPDCTDFLYERLEQVLSKAVEAEDDLAKLRDYWERCQELPEDGQSELVDLMERRIREVIEIPEQPESAEEEMSAVLEAWNASSNEAGSEAYDEKWHELFVDCRDWMIEQVQQLAECSVADIPDWFVALISKPETQPEFLKEEIRITAADIFPKTLT